MDILYKYLLAIHIIFVVCYMAGLFYIVRLFIYHTEAQDKPEPERGILSRQFEIMESRLWNVITIPAGVLLVLAAIGMLIIIPGWLQDSWLHVKLTCVIILAVYHLVCQNKIKQMRNGIFKWTSTQLRLWNELATVLLFVIVICAVVKEQINWPYTIMGLVIFVGVLMAAVKIYKYFRLKK